MICVLDVIEGPAKGKRIWLKENECLEVGRITSADFSIPMDSHLSRRHLLLDSTQNVFRVRDVGSANGTFLNNERVTVQELSDGDRLRAGMTTFLISFRNSGENPHERDGISFHHSPPTTPRESSTGMTVSSGEELTRVAQEPIATNNRTIDFADRFDLESTVRISPEQSQAIIAAVRLDNIDGDLPDEMAKASEHEWWKTFFTPTGTSNLFEQSTAFVGSQGEYVGLLRKFAESHRLVLIVNQSQLERNAVLVIEQLRLNGLVGSLSQTLCYFDAAKMIDPWSLVQMCVSQDAIICIGGLRTPTLQELVPFANSLGYPSMLLCHLRNPTSEIGRFLLSRGSFAMFEMDNNGAKLGLLIQ